MGEGDRSTWSQLCDEGVSRGRDDDGGGRGQGIGDGVGNREDGAAGSGVVGAGEVGGGHGLSSFSGTSAWVGRLLLVGVRSGG